MFGLIEIFYYGLTVKARLMMPLHQSVPKHPRQQTAALVAKIGNEAFVQVKIYIPTCLTYEVALCCTSETQATCIPLQSLLKRYVLWPPRGKGRHSTHGDCSTPASTTPITQFSQAAIFLVSMHGKLKFPKLANVDLLALSLCGATLKCCQRTSVQRGNEK